MKNILLLFLFLLFANLANMALAQCNCARPDKTGEFMDNNVSSG